ncbi:unnamed protein product [Linum tenue]|uniref:beta-galactosidase n=1 Tax=Linum tenue TaxID=586396 RepID=A0AAV0S569_9ROSI|nr:unnamed protein product [Linum tenue]
MLRPLLLVLLCSSTIWVSSVTAAVTYDSKAIVVNGKRRILLSGSIHYPRSTPEMWPDLIQKAKDGGLDVIQTYVFWNGHEPSPGQYYFEDRYDLVKFVKLVQQAGLYVNLRIGPYVCAEWNFGGFPVWLKYVPGISFRTDNGPFKMMKQEKLFEPQGGPIILSQIENELDPVEYDIGAPAKAYGQWAGKMAVALNTGVPWIMCKQEDAPDPVINTCNAFYCENFRPNKSYKPKMWTEAWSGWFTAFGSPVPYRPAEDLAFGIARFIQNGGSYANYYMYHGGTNFGRTAGGPFVATSYDYDAPLDEYGLTNEPKYSHLKQMHKAIKQSETALVSADATVRSLGKNQEWGCAAFLANYDVNYAVKVKFGNGQYDLPAWSISILPDCKTEVYNTAKVRVTSGFASDTTTLNGLWEQLYVTKDSSDYLWYMTDIKIGSNEAFLKNGNDPVLTVQSAGHFVNVFVNGKLIGSAYGNKDDPKLTFSQSVKLNIGVNKIALLSASVGLANVGAHFENYNVGVLGPVTLKGLNQGTVDMTKWKWSYKVGVQGEKLQLNTITGSSSVEWSDSKMLAKKQPLSWYKTTFNTPEGNEPLALDMISMGKGQVWINGQSIGRYWPAYKAEGNCGTCYYGGYFSEKKCLSNCGQPSQRWYHVPRSWLKAGGNLMVVFEEWGGDPTGISMVKRG